MKADAAAAARTTSRFLNPIFGDDVSNDGTTSTQPWRTLSRALLFLEQRASSSPHSSASSTSSASSASSSVIIELAPGTYHLQNGTLALDARHSGSGPGSEVIFRASDPTPGATVVSGGVPLDATHGVTWQYNATSGAWVGDLDTVNHPSLAALAAAGINAMSVHRPATKPVTAAPAAAAAAATVTANPPSSSPPSLSSPPASSQTPLRRARWPNGDPTTYCARDLHGGNCKGYAQVSNTLTKGTSQGIVQVGPTNVLVRSKESGAVIFNGTTYTHTHSHINNRDGNVDTHAHTSTSTTACPRRAYTNGDPLWTHHHSSSPPISTPGTMRPFHAQHEFNVSSPTVAWQARKETRSTFFAFTGGSLDRYDNTTYAYYEATVPTSATMNGDFAARAKHWGRPEEAVVNIYQSAYGAVSPLTAWISRTRPSQSFIGRTGASKRLAGAPRGQRGVGGSTR